MPAVPKDQMAERRFRLQRTVWALVLGASLGGCVGALEDGPGPVGGRMRATACTTEAPGAAPLRRITEEQWRGAVSDLLGAGASDGVAYPRAIYRRGYRTDGVIAEISRDGVVALMDAASQIAERSAMTGFPLTCTPGTAPDDACVLGFIDTFGARAYRRPLRDAERASLRGLYSDLRMDSLSQTESLTGVVEAILASPQFNYITSDVEALEGGAIRLDDHALAERLAFFLWNEPPDAALRQAADEGRLHTREDVAAAARRMVTDPRTAHMLGGFVEDWLELHRARGMAKDNAAYPAWSTGLSASVASEHYAFVDEVFLRGDARLQTLLGSNYAVVDSELAALYETPSMGRASLPRERRGLLTFSGFLAGHAGATESAPVLRGVTIMRQVLCEDMELPRGLVVTSPPQDPSRTTRERFTAHRELPECASCHDRIDPIGFAFEDFDAVGGHRSVDEHGHAVDARTEIRNVTGTFEVSANGGASVADALAESRVVRACFARQVLNYAEGREVGRGSDGAADQCALAQITAPFEASGGDVRELLVAIATSDAFMTRRVR